MVDQIIQRYPLRLPYEAHGVPEHAADIIFDIVDAGMTVETRKQHYRYIARFVAWCRSANLPYLPASTATVAAFLAYVAKDAKPGTVRAYRTSIRHFHKGSNLPDPTFHPVIRTLFEGIDRTSGPPEQARPLSVDEIRTIVGAISDEIDMPVCVRDRALILTAYAGAIEPGILRSLQRERIEFSDGGAVLYTSDPERPWISIASGSSEETCPVRALKRWLWVSRHIPTGPLFLRNAGGYIREAPMEDPGMQATLRRRCRAAGVDAANISMFSLRHGFLSDAVSADVPVSAMLCHMGYKATSALPRNVKRQLVRNGKLGRRPHRAGMRFKK